MELSGNMVGLVGGLMMGSAVVLFHHFLTRDVAASGPGGKSASGRRKLVVSFALGTAIGAFLMIGFVQDPGQGPSAYTLAGLAAGALATVLAVRSSRH